MNYLLFLSVFIFVSCGGNEKIVKESSPINQALSNEGSISIDIDDIAPGLACHSGGVSIFTFRDKNSDAFLDLDESIIKVKSICNGLDGSNGTDGSNGVSPTLTVESISSTPTCPQGGVKISSSSSAPVEVCNGANGLNGAQGIAGAQGIPGMTGSQGEPGADGARGEDGASITPVKFCESDDSSLPEYGLLIGKELFAVYWGETPASPKKSQAFLTKLVAGNYQSTGGNNCLFSIE